MGRTAAISVTVTTAVSCSVDADCPTGYICQDGVCVQAPPQCTVDADCAEGYVCQGGVCVKLPPSIAPLKLVLVTLAVFGGGVGIYYGLRGKKK